MVNRLVTFEELYGYTVTIEFKVLSDKKLTLSHQVLILNIPYAPLLYYAPYCAYRYSRHLTRSEASGTQNKYEILWKQKS